MNLNEITEQIRVNGDGKITNFVYDSVTGYSVFMQEWSPLPFKVSAIHGKGKEILVAIFSDIEPAERYYLSLCKRFTNLYVTWKSWEWES